MNEPTAQMVLQRLDQQDRVLAEIKTQTTVTNGRVRKLEIWQAQLLGARQAISWVPPTIIAVVAAVAGALAARLIGI